MKVKPPQKTINLRASVCKPIDTRELQGIAAPHENRPQSWISGLSVVSAQDHGVPPALQGVEPPEGRCGLERSLEPADGGGWGGKASLRGRENQPESLICGRMLPGLGSRHGADTHSPFAGESARAVDRSEWPCCRILAADAFWGRDLSDAGSGSPPASPRSIQPLAWHSRQTNDTQRTAARKSQRQIDPYSVRRHCGLCAVRP